MEKNRNAFFPTSTIQHVFKFSNALECWTSYLLVCKDWKHAVETLKFPTRTLRSGFFKMIDFLMMKHNTVPHFVVQLIKSFNRIEFPLKKIGSHSSPSFSILMIENLNSLKRIHFLFVPKVLDSLRNSQKKNLGMHYRFMLINQLIKNSISTLEHLGVHSLTVFEKIQLPELMILDLKVGRHCTGLSDFQNLFEKMLENSPNIKIINLCLQNFDICVYADVLEFVSNKYGQHCLTFNAKNLPCQVFKHIRAKMIIEIQHIESIAGFKDLRAVEYLQIYFQESKSYATWKNFENI